MPEFIQGGLRNPVRPAIPLPGSDEVLVHQRTAVRAGKQIGGDHACFLQHGPLRLDLFHADLRELEGPLCVVVLALGDLPADIDGAPHNDLAALDIGLVLQAGQLPGAEARDDREPIGMDIPVLHRLAAPGGHIRAEECYDAVR